MRKETAADCVCASVRVPVAGSADGPDSLSPSASSTKGIRCWPSTTCTLAAWTSSTCISAGRSRMRLVGFDLVKTCRASVMHTSLTKTDRFQLLIVSVAEGSKEKCKT